MRELNPHKVREMSAEEVRLKISDLREEMFNLRFRNSMRQLDNPLKLREARRDLARLLTILKEHDMGLRTLGAGLAAKSGAAAAAAAGDAAAAAEKKPAARKTVKKKTAAKKTAAKKTATRKAAAPRAAAKKPAARKPAAAKAAARKTTRKAPAGAGK